MSSKVKRIVCVWECAYFTQCYLFTCTVKIDWDISSTSIYEYKINTMQSFTIKHFYLIDIEMIIVIYIVTNDSTGAVKI